MADPGTCSCYYHWNEIFAGVFEVHLLKFEILQITWKNKIKNIKMPSLLMKNWKLRVWYSLFHIFHVIGKISNLNMWTAKHLYWFDFNHFWNSRAEIRQFVLFWFFGKLKIPKSHSEINWPLGEDCNFRRTDFLVNWRTKVCSCVKKVVIGLSSLCNTS